VRRRSGVARMSEAISGALAFAEMGPHVAIASKTRINALTAHAGYEPCAVVILAPSFVGFVRPDCNHQAHLPPCVESNFSIAVRGATYASPRPPFQTAIIVLAARSRPSFDQLPPREGWRSADRRPVLARHRWPANNAREPGRLRGAPASLAIGTPRLSALLRSDFRPRVRVSGPAISCGARAASSSQHGS
jgi:hypothetical protein